MAEEKSSYIKLLEEEREASLQNKARVTDSTFCFFFLSSCPSGRDEILQSSRFSQHYDTVQCFLITDRKAGEIQREPEAEQEKDPGSTCQGMEKKKQFCDNVSIISPRQFLEKSCVFSRAPSSWMRPRFGRMPEVCSPKLSRKIMLPSRRKTKR